MRKWRIACYNQSKPERNNYHCYIECASQVVKESKWFLQCQHEFMHQQTRGWNYQLCYKILRACHKYAIIEILVLSFLFFGPLSVTLLLWLGNFAPYSSHNTGQNGFHVSHINIQQRMETSPYIYLIQVYPYPYSWLLLQHGTDVFDTLHMLFWRYDNDWRVTSCGQYG